MKFLKKEDNSQRVKLSGMNSIKLKFMKTNLSLTAPPDNTPPYARFTVLLFLDSLDLLYSAGLK